MKQQMKNDQRVSSSHVKDLDSTAIKKYGFLRY